MSGHEDCYSHWSTSSELQSAGALHFLDQSMTWLHVGAVKVFLKLLWVSLDMMQFAREDY